MQVMFAKSAKNAHTVKNAWSSHHPKLDKVVMDNGPESSGDEWEFVLGDWGIKKGRISSHAPTCDVVVESSHRVFGWILHTTLHGTDVRTMAELEATFDDACAFDACVMHCVSNTMPHREWPMEDWCLVGT